jgi:hypothetical protein
VNPMRASVELAQAAESFHRQSQRHAESNNEKSVMAVVADVPQPVAILGPATWD